MQGAIQKRPIAAYGALWSAAVAFFLVAFLLALSQQFRFRWDEAMMGGGQLLLSGVTSFYLLRSDKGYKLGLFMSGLFLYALIATGTAIMAMSLATLNAPWFDEALLRMDRAIGYDWRTYVFWAKSHPHLILLLAIAYSSLLWQPTVLFALLPIANMDDRLLRYLVANFAALVITVLIFAAMPVTAAWVYENSLTNAEMQMLHLPRSDNGWIHQLLELRAGRVRLIGWETNAAIIGFPSFHCAAALINIWAFWNSRMLRCLFVPLNIAMIAATPIMGGHYLVDLIAGAMVAAVSLYFARRISEVSFEALAEMLRSLSLPRIARSSPDVDVV